MNDFQTIATVNTHLLNKEMLESMVENGATILRINGSHIQPAEISFYSTEIRKVLGRQVKILVDLPGNKIRTAIFSQPLPLSAEKTFELRSDQLNYPKFLEHLSPGDILLANDSLFKFRVESVTQQKAVLYSYSEGLLTSNKGVHLTGRHLPFPFLFERDRELIREAIRNGIDYVGLSFVRSPEDVQEVKDILKDTSVSLIVKVETGPAVENLQGILQTADEFLVDRGDLSCDVGIENIDRFQKLILKTALRANKKVYFATQFLHSMLHNNVPLIAEVCGLADAIEAGVYGVQLSEETAIGRHPIEALKIIQRVLKVSNRGMLSKAKPGLAPVLWLTGRSGAGKTTIAREICAQIESLGQTCCLIDGDDFRSFWKGDLGYSKEDRIKNLRNMTFTAFQASRSFDVVVVASLSPYIELRNFAREKIPNFHEIYIECPQQVCVERDPKGHYKKAAAGEHQNFIGVTEEYEEPERPELVLKTDQRSVAESVAQLKHYFLQKDGAGARC